jgi:hypothetical protein
VRLQEVLFEFLRTQSDAGPVAGEVIADFMTLDQELANERLLVPDPV